MERNSSLTPLQTCDTDHSSGEHSNNFPKSSKMNKPSPPCYFFFNFSLLFFIQTQGYCKNSDKFRFSHYKSLIPKVNNFICPFDKANTCRAKNCLFKHLNKFKNEKEGTQSYQENKSNYPEKSHRDPYETYQNSYENSKQLHSQGDLNRPNNENPRNRVKNLIYKEMKILVIGATGAGKSSLINLFYVWSQNWKPQDFMTSKRVVIKTEFLDGDGETERNLKNQGVSQTLTAKVYTFELKNLDKGYHFSLSFMDTPGIGDTNGLDQDDINLNTILESVQKTSDLNAILLVMNGADARINNRIKYIMTKLKGMIPDALVENLIVLLTNVDLKPNLDINQVLDFDLDKSKIFYYNNQLFQLNPSELHNQNTLKRANQAFENSIEILSDMLNLMSLCSLKPTKAFMKIKEARDLLKTKLVECNVAEAKVYKKQKQLQDLLAQIADGKTQISYLQKQLNKTVTEKTSEQVKTPHHNTICLTCENCCHENCGLDETTIQGSSYFQSCTAFDGKASCNECKHDFSSHVHLRYKYVKRTQQVPKINPQLQIALQQAQQNSSSKDVARNAINAELKKLDAELQKHHHEIQKIVTDMRAVCSGFDYLKEVEACINVLDEKIEFARIKFGMNLNDNDALKLNGLEKTKKRMETFKNDLVKYLKTSSTSQNKFKL